MTPLSRFTKGDKRLRRMRMPLERSNVDRRSRRRLRLSTNDTDRAVPLGSVIMLDRSHLVDFPGGTLVGERDGKSSRNGCWSRVALDHAAKGCEGFVGEREGFDGGKGRLRGGA